MMTLTHCMPACSSGLKALQTWESLCSMILSWKADLEQIEAIKASGCLINMQESVKVPPSCHQFGVAMYSCMSVEILLREVTSENASQILSDAKQLGTFLSNVLKLSKTQIPKHLTSAIDKLLKDLGFKGHSMKTEVATIV